MGAAFLRYATLAQCEAIHAQCLAELALGHGSLVLSSSGGGENETRGEPMPIQELLGACQRRMSQLNPVAYPPMSNRLTPSFSGGVD